MKNSNSPIQLSNELAKAILTFNSAAALRNFFRDLCTLDEIKEMNERWQTVLLLEKNLPYREIAKKLQISTTTVARVAYWLNNGQGGYRQALQATKTHPLHKKPSS
jgi:TrpR-related protein YerC/YecD